ncbi:MAG: hypothetical protein KVP17_003107 [Porospora cf. gigantea B]|uniref:uncharacterized protein n=1 Tax=Porospora cf. gigantea B TaxID=2853592 RepID=UPI003571E268|nr:MAG: hypothetical protein KVP17_003107 [Porospora cf. gigantea B]
MPRRRQEHSGRYSRGVDRDGRAYNEITTYGGGKEIVEKIVERIVKKEKIVPIPVIEKVERIVHKVVPVIEEKIVEVPKIEIIEKPVEEVVEVEQIEIVEKVVDVPVDQHVDVEVRVEKDVPVMNDVSRFEPEAYETVQPYKFILRGVGAEYVITIGGNADTRPSR